MRRCLLSLFLLVLVSCNNQQEKTEKVSSSQESKRIVILVHGYPACGKLTVAKALAKKYNLNLMDNHFFNNIIFPYVELNTPNVIAIDPEINKIRKIWMDNVVKYGKKDKGFVFTNVLIASKSAEQDIENLRNFAKELDYQFLSVKLVCDENDIKGRINSKERKQRHKLTDYTVWKQYIDNTKFLDIEDSILVKNSNIDNTLARIDKEVR